MNLGVDGLQIDPGFCGKKKLLKVPAKGYIEKDTSFKASHDIHIIITNEA
jgi:hypothetical protein